jgi:hypothetical protein
MSAKSRATRYRQWAANAIADALRTTNWVERETLLMIAQQHLAQAQKAEQSRHPAPDGLSPREARPTKH